MKKILGVLTLHSVFNEGAVLQAFSLVKHLQNNFPDWKVEIIDYRFASLLKAYGSPKDRRTLALDDFIANALPLSGERFFNDKDRDISDFINKRYGALVVGSDEVWDPYYLRRKRYLGLIYRQTGRLVFPNPYWPGAEVDVPKAAYAACVGRADWTKIPGRHRKEMARRLSTFSVLGVR
ncbi:MAG: hypothetical protein KAS86_01515, partial [Candidatus Omnitrophica bacterium]|nr:hypothetical protein [Candidatus Omnitrophota bacterium]